MFVILWHTMIHTCNPQKPPHWMQPLCKILVDKCSIKATFVMLSLQRIPQVDLRVSGPFYTRFSLKARRGCFMAALTLGICQLGSKHRTLSNSDNTDSLASGLSQCIGSDAPLNEAFAQALIGRSIHWNPSWLQDLLPWVEIRGQHINAYSLCHICCCKPEFNLPKSQNINIEWRFSCFPAVVIFMGQTAAVT